MIGPPFRIGTGEITDHAERKTGQLDIVIEYATSLSFPLLRGDAARLYLAESVCAVVEVKSNIAKEWEDGVLKTARSVAALRRDPGQVLGAGVVPNRLPFFAVGYAGWKSVEAVAEKLNEATVAGAIVDGLLIIESGIYHGRAPNYSDHSLSGAASLGGFLLSLEQLTSSMIGAKPCLLPYFKTGSS